MTVYRLILSCDKPDHLKYWIQRLTRLGIIQDHFINEYPEPQSDDDG